MFKRLRQFLLRDTSSKSCPGGLAVWLQVPALWQRSRELAAAAQEVDSWDDLAKKRRDA